MVVLVPIEVGLLTLMSQENLHTKKKEEAALIMQNIIQEVDGLGNKTSVVTQPRKALTLDIVLKIKLVTILMRSS